MRKKTPAREQKFLARHPKKLALHKEAQTITVAAQYIELAGCYHAATMLLREVESPDSIAALTPLAQKDGYRKR